MFEPPLSERLWPIRLKPYNDELISSWLVRLSRAYGTDPRRFCRRLWRHAAFWDRDIDKAIDDNILNILAHKTDTPWAQVYETTLPGYLGFAIRKIPNNSFAPWILKRSLRDHGPLRPWLQYCPDCLQDDDDPYFRCQWRLTFVTTCPQHSCQLLDRCAMCLAPFHIHQTPSDADTITHCAHCQFDARRARAPRVDSEVRHHRVIQFQVLLLESLRRGWYPLCRTLSVLTEEYLAVLLHLGRMLISRYRAQELRRAFCRHLGEPDLEPCFPSAQKRAIESLSVADRFSLLVLLAWWLDDWPDRFVAMCTRVQLSLTDLGDSFPFQPDWYEDVVERVARGPFTSTDVALDGVARSAASSLAALMDKA